MALIRFVQWAPDLAPLGSPGLTNIENAQPGDGGAYAPFPSAVATTGVLDAYCRGAVAMRADSGDTYNYAGDGSKLYQVTAGGATDRSKVGGYALAARDGWRFAKFGNQIIATTITADVQALTLGGAQFADLGGSPPKAAYVGTVGPQDAYLAIANIDDPSDGLKPNRVRFCERGNSASWPIVNQQDLEGNGGRIQALVGGEYGVIFQETALWRMDWIGGDVVFAINQLEADGHVGTPAPNSPVRVGNKVYYLSNDGFHVFDGANSRGIGVGRVDRTFTSLAKTEALYRMVGFSIGSLVGWAFTTGDTAGNDDPDMIFVYDFERDQWGRGRIDLEYAYTAISLSTTLDEITTPLDDLQVSLDDPVWSGDVTLPALYDRAHTLSHVNGPPLAATLETGELAPNGGGTARLHSVRPFVDATMKSIQAGYRTYQEETVTWSPQALTDQLGAVDFRLDDRYYRFRLNIGEGEDWTLAQGVDPSFTATGRR